MPSFVSRSGCLYVGRIPNPEPQKKRQFVTARDAKIVERRTFDLINYTRKYKKLDKMAESKACNNLGIPRTENRPIIKQFLIG